MSASIGARLGGALHAPKTRRSTPAGPVPVEIDQLLFACSILLTNTVMQATDEREKLKLKLLPSPIPNDTSESPEPPPEDTIKFLMSASVIVTRPIK